MINPTGKKFADQLIGAATGLFNNRAKFIFPEPEDLRKLSFAELTRRFYHPDEPGKLAIIRQLCENYWAGEYFGQELLAVEYFLRRFIDEKHELHRTHLPCLVGYQPLPESEKREIIKQAEMIIFCFLTCSEISPDCQKLLDGIKLNPPSRHFMADAAEAIKYSKLTAADEIGR